jgi:hypothetical protein
MQPIDFIAPQPDGQSPSTPDDSRAPYATPCLEPLGTWQALTLQQSVPITGFHRDTDSTGFGGRYGEG